MNTKSMSVMGLLAVVVALAVAAPAAEAGAPIDVKIRNESDLPLELYTRAEGGPGGWVPGEPGWKYIAPGETGLVGRVTVGYAWPWEDQSRWRAVYRAPLPGGDGKMAYVVARYEKDWTGGGWTTCEVRTGPDAGAPVPGYSCNPYERTNFFGFAVKKS